MKTQFDIPSLTLIYEGSKNYKIIDGEIDAPNRCFIFFSSNGIYFPNTEEEFHQKIIVEDRYEWKYLSPKKSQYRKAIFVRDVRKTWYIDGISAERNSIEAVYQLLITETFGFSEVVCIGSSAGGYAATLFGVLLNAKKIFNISGFFEITTQAFEPTNLALQSAQLNSLKSKWFDLCPLLINCESAIYFLYPKNSELDMAQARTVKNLQCVRFFGFDESTHGVCAQNFIYPVLFTKTNSEIDTVFFRNKDRSWKKFEFSVASIGLTRSLLFSFIYISKKLSKSLRNYI